MDFDARGQQKMYFLTGGSVVLDNEVVFRQKQKLNDWFYLTNKHIFTSQDWHTEVVWITCGLSWCFISCLDSHSDGTHSLQRIQWWENDVMILFSDIFWWRNKLIYIFGDLKWLYFQQILVHLNHKSHNPDSSWYLSCFLVKWYLKIL